MNLIDKYIESLTEHLGRNVGQTRDQVAEIRTHLEMDARDRVEAGSSQVDAELAACKAMGSRQVIAHQIIRQARGYATASAWRLAWPCGLFLMLAMIIPYSMLGKLQYQQVADPLVRWAPFFALLLFVYRVAQTKRWLVRPMALWAALATVGILVGNTVTISQNPAPALLESGRAAIRDALTQAQAEQHLVDMWKKGAPPLNKAPLIGAVDASFVVPFLPFAIGGMDQSLSLEDSSPSDAATRWTKYGAMYAINVQDRKRYLEAALTGAQTPTLSKSEMALNQLKLWAMFTAYQVIVFCVVNAGLLAFIRTREKRKARREPLFA